MDRLYNLSPVGKDFNEENFLVVWNIITRDFVSGIMSELGFPCQLLSVMALPLQEVTNWWFFGCLKLDPDRLILFFSPSKR